MLAITQKKLIKFLNKNNDDVHKMFMNCGYDECFPLITKNIKLNKIQDIIDKNRLIKLLEDNAISYSNIIDGNKVCLKKQKKTECIDWGYHCIKYLTYYYNIIINIISTKDQAAAANANKSQLFVVLNLIANKKIVSYSVNDFWEYLDNYNRKTYKQGEIGHIPLCKISDKAHYIKYHDIIYHAIAKVQKKIKFNMLNDLSVYESIILAYLIELFMCKRYSNITPMDLYNITDFFNNDNENENHNLALLLHINAIQFSLEFEIHAESRDPYL